MNDKYQPKSDQASHRRDSLTLDDAILEAWSQGFLVGALIILIMITISNFRGGVLLHKLILVELFLAMPHGTFIFCSDPVYGWYLSSTAVLLYSSWYLHDVIAWMKNKPFLPRWGSYLYIGTVALAFPYWIAEMYYNFQYFNSLGHNDFVRLRPWEILARDPWWIFTTCNLIYVIKKEYGFSMLKLVRASPRFGLLIFSMIASIAFLLTDTVVSGAHLGSNSGINPYWKLAAVFKCAADALFLDDFKKVLDTLWDTSSKTIRNDDVNDAMDTQPLPPTVPPQPLHLSPQSSSQMRDFGLTPVPSQRSSNPPRSPTRSRNPKSHSRRHTLANAASDRLHLPHFLHPQRHSSDNARPSDPNHASPHLHARAGSTNSSTNRKKEWWDSQEEEMQREQRREEASAVNGLGIAENRPQHHQQHLHPNTATTDHSRPATASSSTIGRSEEFEFLTSAV